MYSYQAADAVTAAVNDIEWPGNVSPFTYTAQRVYTPAFDTEAMGESPTVAYVQVFTSEHDLELTTIDPADPFIEELTVEVAIAQRLPAGIDPTSTAANAAIDPIVKFATDIAYNAYAAGDTIDGTPGGAVWMETKIPLLFDKDYLRKDRLVFVVLKFKFKQDQLGLG